MRASRSQPCGAEKEPLPPSSEVAAAYRADGLRVIKNPVRHTQPDGSRTVTLGFTVCTVAEVVGEEGATEIARVLNSHDDLLEASKLGYLMICRAYHAEHEAAMEIRAAIAKATGQ